MTRTRLTRHADPDAHVAATWEKVVLLLVVTLPLVATAAAVLLLWNRWVTWLDVGIFAGMYVITACGIGVGFHRMLTHRSFESDYPAVRFVFLAMGSMALQGPAVEWAATHVKHHAKSDKEGDPHSPLEGFWHAHVGWLFRDRLIKSGVWAKPFENDKVAHAVDNQFWLWAILSFALPGLAGLAIGHTWGAFWSAVLWGGLVRLAIGHHVTWSVNSVCHTFGQREFESNDESRNEWVVGLLGLGEGWHNNHHAFPKAAYHGMKWYQIDFNAYVIRVLRRVGLVKNVWMPKREDMDARRVKRSSQGVGGPAATLGLAPRGR
jgi:stearoyl-CoA desaturase (delta-9 desaturase)